MADKTELDDLFAHAQAHAPLPSGDLLARIEAQGVALQPAPPVPRKRWYDVAQILSAIGGAPGAAGLVAASAAGVWIGMDPPLLMDAVLGTVSDVSSIEIDPLTGFDFAFVEG